jgi:hypothetical protein
VLLALVTGCGAGHDAMEKQIAEMRSEITRLRAGHAALTERLESLEIERGTYNKNAAHPPPRAMEGDKPSLDVVRLTPGEEAEPEDGPRPMIRAIGNEGSIQGKKSGARGPPKKGGPAAPSKKPAGDASPPGMKP